MVTKDLKSTKGITLISLIVTIVVLLILVGISLSVLTGENGILAQTKSARIKTELSKFIEEGEFAYSELYAERVNNPEVVILESDIIAKLMSNYGYEGRITEITDGVPTNIAVGNIIEDVVANGEKVIVGVQKVGGNSTYYVELLGKYYPIHFNNLEISVKEEEWQEQAGRVDNTEFSVLSDNEEVVIATAKNTNGVLTIELEGKSRGTANVTITYGNLESKIIQVNVKGKTRIIVEAEKDENQVAKGNITSPSELVDEYVDGAQISLEAMPFGSYKFKGWYIGDILLSTNASYNYTVQSNLTSQTTIVAKFKDTEPTDIFVSFEESTGTLRFYNSEHNDEPEKIIGILYTQKNKNRNIKTESFTYDSPWYSSRTSINKVIIEDEIVPLYISSWFRGCSNLTEIQNLGNINTSKIEDMSYLFYQCKELTNIDISGFDTSSVTNFDYMFDGCKGLTSLDVSVFDTSSATSFNRTFAECSGLTSLDVSAFNTSNVNSLFRTFANCSGLTLLDVSHFDTSKVKSLSGTFTGCSGLTSLDVSGFDTSNVTSMNYLFNYCSGVSELDISNFDTSKVTNMAYMFSNCISLESLDVSGFDTSNVTDMQYMFGSDIGKVGLEKVTVIDVSNFDTSNVTNMRSMFMGVKNVRQLDVSNFDTSNVIDMMFMFNGCKSLENLNVSNFDTSKVTNIGYMFCHCEELKTLDLSNFETSNVNKMMSMFTGCSNLNELDLSNFDTSKIEDMYNMFAGCKKLKTIDISNFNTSKVTDMRNVFSGCSELTTIYVSKLFSTGALKNSDSSYHMFYNCGNLVGGNGTTYDSKVVGGTYAKIDKVGQKGYFTDISQKPAEE